MWGALTGCPQNPLRKREAVHTDGGSRAFHNINHGGGSGGENGHVARRLAERADAGVRACGHT